MQDKDILKKIAVKLCYMDYMDMTHTERQIADILVDAGLLKMEEHGCGNRIWNEYVIPET